MTNYFTHPLEKDSQLRNVSLKITDINGINCLTFSTLIHNNYCSSSIRGAHFKRALIAKS